MVQELITWTEEHAAAESEDEAANQTSNWPALTRLPSALCQQPRAKLPSVVAWGKNMVRLNGKDLLTSLVWVIIFVAGATFGGWAGIELYRLSRGHF